MTEQQAIEIARSITEGRGNADDTISFLPNRSPGVFLDLVFSAVERPHDYQVRYLVMSRSLSNRLILPLDIMGLTSGGKLWGATIVQVNWDCPLIAVGEAQDKEGDPLRYTVLVTGIE